MQPLISSYSISSLLKRSWIFFFKKKLFVKYCKIFYDKIIVNCSSQSGYQIPKVRISKTFVLLMAILSFTVFQQSQILRLILFVLLSYSNINPICNNQLSDYSILGPELQGQLTQMNNGFPINKQTSPNSEGLEKLPPSIHQLYSPLSIFPILKFY